MCRANEEQVARQERASDCVREIGVVTWTDEIGATALVTARLLVFPREDHAWTDVLLATFKKDRRVNIRIRLREA
jgi:hypothetical protein